MDKLINNVKNYVPINNVKNYVPINPFPFEWGLRALINFTLSNARRFYSSTGNLLDGKGLKDNFIFYHFKSYDICFVQESQIRDPNFYLFLSRR